MHTEITQDAYIVRILSYELRAAIATPWEAYLMTPGARVNKVQVTMVDGRVGLYGYDPEAFPHNLADSLAMGYQTLLDSHGRLNARRKLSQAAP
jgi:hypothetical protein